MGRWRLVAIVLVTILAILVAFLATWYRATSLDHTNIKIDQVENMQQEMQLQMEAQWKAIEEMQETLLSIQDNMDDLFYKQKNISLDEELQEYVFFTAIEYGVDPNLIFAIMENESRFMNVGLIVDTNGLYSVGRMQINQPNWKWLEDEYNIDVHDEFGNIHGGIVILYRLMEKYDTEKALVAYQCGEGGSYGIESTEFSRKIIRRSKEIMQI